MKRNKRKTENRAKHIIIIVLEYDDDDDDDYYYCIGIRWNKNEVN